MQLDNLCCSFNSSGLIGPMEVTEKIPHNIHLIWIGSELPDRYKAGPLSFAQLNKGKGNTKIFRN